MLRTLLAIAAGAAIGANLRWLLSIALNPLFAGLPSGTLMTNWLGCYLIGIALPILNNLFPQAPELRPFIVTGLLGSLTTFSSFSAEMIDIVQEGRYYWAIVGVLLHVLGSLIMTVLGMGTVHLFQQ